jgi:hypothetical protein
VIIHSGTQERLIYEATSGAGSTSREGSVMSDSLLATLWVNSITSGTLDVSVYTLTDTGKELLLFSFPTQAAPSTNLLLKMDGTGLQRFRVQVTYTGVCSYEVYIRAVAGASTSGTASHVIVDNTPLPVTIVGDAPTGTVMSVFSEALAVASSATQTILTYTVPVGKTAYLLRADMSGTTIATYNVLVNGSEFARRRTYWSGEFNEKLEIGNSVEDAYKIMAGDIVTIQVTNFRPVSNDFEARLQYIEV